MCGVTVMKEKEVMNLKGNAETMIGIGGGKLKGKKYCKYSQPWIYKCLQEGEHYLIV